MQLRHILGAGAGLFLASVSYAQTVTTVVNNGPVGELYDMVILGDGYRAAEQAQFNSDVADIVDYFQNQASVFPYGDYFQCYNVHSVFRASVESGADDPCANPPITRNTGSTKSGDEPTMSVIVHARRAGRGQRDAPSTASATRR